MNVDATATTKVSLAVAEKPWVAKTKRENTTTAENTTLFIVTPPFVKNGKLRNKRFHRELKKP